MAEANYSAALTVIARAISEAAGEHPDAIRRAAGPPEAASPDHAIPNWIAHRKAARAALDALRALDAGSVAPEGIVVPSDVWAVGGWRPIETAPAYETILVVNILGHMTGYGPRCGCKAILFGDDGKDRVEWSDPYHGSIYEPSHWMPLPEAPVQR